MINELVKNLKKVPSKSALQVFGANPTNTKRNLVKALHPDTLPDDEKSLGAEGINEVTRLWDALEAYDPLVIAGQPVGSFLGVGDISEVYEYGSGQVIKVVTNEDDEDLLRAEFETLDTLRKLVDTQVFDAIPYPNAVGREGDIAYAIYDFDPTLVLPRNLFRISSVPLDQRSIGWIWSHVLAALQDVHRVGFIHGGINPDNLLLWDDGQNHGVVLVDWKYASAYQEPLTMLPKNWSRLYPKEIPQKNKPSPSLDSYLAAKTILECAPDLPREMINYFRMVTWDGEIGRESDEIILRDLWKTTIYDKLNFKREFVPLGYKPFSWATWQG